MKTFNSTREQLIYVTGIGMVSALGFDAPTSLAAARAGVSRAQSLASYPVPDADDGNDTGLTCHIVPFATAGFEGEVRLSRLAELALQDLVSRQRWLNSVDALACYLSMPDPLRTSVKPVASTPSNDGVGDGEDEGDTDTDEATEDEDGEAPTPVDFDESAESAIEPWSLAESILTRASRSAGLGDAPKLMFVSLAGHTGFARALERACTDLRGGTIDRAIVGGFDSLVDADVLSWLEAVGRLKTPDNPVGLQPGEAGTFVLVETEAACQARGGAASVVLRGLAFGEEENPQGADHPPSGKGLAVALHTIVKGVHFRHRLPLWCITDQNGETYRAQDWGSAQVQIEMTHRAQIVGDLSYVAVAFGDTGAASGGIALCTAVAAFERRYAPASLAAVISAADSGDRAVLLCQAA